MEGTNMILSESKSMRRAVRRSSAILMGLMAAQMAGVAWAAPAASAPRPVASAVAPNGNVVEFYDGEDGVLVSETGVAGSSRVFDPQGKSADRLLDAWRSVAPKDPFPQALAQLEKRMKAIHKLATERSRNPAHKDALPPPPALFQSRPESKPFGGTLMPESSTPKSGMVTNALEGCDNGCCDREWLGTFDECQDGAADYNWFLFNYGWTWSNSPDIWIYKALVCSANGTSKWNVKIGDKRWSWDVPHGHYRTWWWKAGSNPILCGGWCGKDMTSSVNTTSAQQLHTYCGWTFFD
jgi:hypothetical protein